jgi:uncharacterized membrane protein YbaN (DUF454 family)
MVETLRECKKSFFVPLLSIFILNKTYYPFHSHAFAQKKWRNVAKIHRERKALLHYHTHKYLHFGSATFTFSHSHMPVVHGKIVLFLVSVIYVHTIL